MAFYPNIIGDILSGASEEEALEYARGICEYETHSAEIAFGRYVDTVDGIEVYYDFGGDYYFFCEAG